MDDDRPIDDRLLDALSQKIRAEMAREAAERERVEETRRLRVAQERRARQLDAIVGRYANQGEQIAGLIELLQKRLETDVIYSVIREWFEDMSREVDLINDRILLILESVRMIVPQAHRAAIDQMVREPDADIDHRRILRLLHQLRAVEGKPGPEFERLYEAIMAEVVEAMQDAES